MTLMRKKQTGQVFGWEFRMQRIPKRFQFEDVHSSSVQIMVCSHVTKFSPIFYYKISVRYSVNNG